MNLSFFIILKVSGHFVIYFILNRCKASNQEKSSSLKVPTSSATSAVTTASPSAPVGSPSCNTATGTTGLLRKVEKTDKSKPPGRYRGSVPFHKRSAFLDSASETDCFSASSYVMASGPGTQMSTSGNTNFQFKGLNQLLRSSTPSGLPQLHTSVVQPSSLGSPHPGTPLTDGLNSQSTEPAMPTLSPHPPSVKEEETTPMESQDSNVATQSPVTIPESSSTIVIKKEPITESVCVHKIRFAKFFLAV